MHGVALEERPTARVVVDVWRRHGGGRIDSDVTTAERTPMDDTALYVTSAHEIGWGLLLVAVSLTMHAIGMISTLRFHGAYMDRFDKVPTLAKGIVGLILASWMILAVHLCEVLVWSLFFQWKQCFPNLSIAMYFALDEYTTVGSPLGLPIDWRLL